MIRKRYEWKIRGGTLTLGERTLVMGVLNVTPDSFSDGGAYLHPDKALEHALELQRQGADIIDVGAESTRPASERVSEHDEIERLIPVLKRLKNRINVPISVDTYKPAVAELAIQHGALIINDPSGLTWEPELAKVARDSGAGLILNHMRGTPQTWSRLAPMRDVMGEIVSELEACIHRARGGGVDLAQIVVDPGIGFGKRKEQNSEILARLREMERLLLPILVAPSRKSFLAQKSADALEFATAAAVTVCVLNGASIVRVHDVGAMVPVVETAEAVIVAIPEPGEEQATPRVKPGRVVDLDLRPDRKQAGPPRPTVKKPVPPPPPTLVLKPAQPSGESKPREDRPREDRPREDRPREDRPREDRPSRPPRYGDEQRPFRPPVKRSGPGGEGKPRGPRPPGRGRPPRSDDRPFRGSGGPPRGPGDSPFKGPGGPPRGGKDRPPRGGSGGPPRGGGDRPPRGGGAGPRRGPSTPRRRP